MERGGRSSYDEATTLVGPPASAGELSAERSRGGRGSGSERVSPLGVRSNPECQRHPRGGKRRDGGRRLGDWRRAGQMPSRAGRAVRFVVDVVAFGRPLDVRAKSRRRTRLGERDHDRDEQLHQPEQDKRHDGPA